MIKIYYRGGCNSSRRAIKWFEEQRIEFECISISRLPRKELLRLLPLTDNGIASITKRPGKASSDTNNKMIKLTNMSFNDGVNYLSVTPDILQTPIITNKNKVLIGFNKEEIRQFIPRERRREKRLFEKTEENY